MDEVFRLDARYTIETYVPNDRFSNGFSTYTSDIAKRDVGVRMTRTVDNCFDKELCSISDFQHLVATLGVQMRARQRELNATPNVQSIE